ncbi:MAG: FHA domain-containing protein [Minicystis sp.]
MASSVLDLTLALEESGLEPKRAVRLHLAAEISAVAPGIERQRPPLSVAIAVDASGSMRGPPMEQVMLSIDRLVGLLEGDDRVGVVAFSDSATDVAELTAIDVAARRLISSRVHRIEAEGGTNMESGLRRAAAMLPPRKPHERQVILLLSDGAPNRGLASAAELSALARSFRPDVAVSTLGYGAHHQEDVLLQLAEGGAGRYHFIADPSVCELEFAQALGAQGDVVAEGIELTLIPSPGVEIARFLGKSAVRFGAAGLKIAIPDLLDGSHHLTVAEVDFEARREPGPWTVLRAQLSYRRAGERELQTLERALIVPVGQGRAVRDPVVRARVLRAKADEARAEARKLADRGQFEGAAAVLRSLIKAIQDEPGYVAGDGSPLSETVEQLLDEAMAMERKPAAEDYRAFRRSTMGLTMSYLSGAESAGPMSRAALSQVGGKLPTAFLRVVLGAQLGTRFALGATKMTIGRTAAAQIQLTEANISRQHAQIVAQDGRFLVVDLGSTNPTMVNGSPLSRPWPLSPGDVVRVGEIELRYEEEP